MHRRLLTLFAATTLLVGTVVPWAGASLAAPTAATASPSSTSSSAGALPTLVAPSAAGAVERLLPTGDRVRTRTKAGQTSYGVVRAQTSGPGSVLRQWRVAGRQFVAPVSALPYVGGVLDPALFNVSRPAAAGPLTVTVRHTGGTPRLPGVLITSDRSGVATGTLSAASAPSFGAAIARQWSVDRGRPAATGLFAGVTRISPAGAASAPAARPAGPRYTLVIKGLDTRGKPLGYAAGLVLDVSRGSYTDLVEIVRGEARISVPAGTYSGSFVASEFSGTSGTSWLVPLGEVVVRGPGRTVTVDLRSATIRPSVATPRPTADGPSSVSVLTYDRVDATSSSFTSQGLIAGGGSDVRLAPVGPATVGTQSFGSSYHLESARGDYVYDLAWSADRIDRSQVRTVTTPELATSTERHDTDRPGSSALFGRTALDPAASFSFSLLTPLTVPATRTAYVASGFTTLWSEEEDGTPLADDPSPLVGTQRYLPGTTSTVTWRRGPLGAAVTPPSGPFPACSACRSRSGIDLYVSPFSDTTSSHVGGLYQSFSGAPVTHVRLTRGSQVLVDEDDRYGVVGLPVPAAAATYRMTVDVDRYGSAPELSTRSHTELGFRSAAGAGTPAPSSWICAADCRVLPILQGRAIVPTDQTGTLAPGSRLVTVELGRIAGATPAGITEATLSLRPAGYGPQEFPLVSAGGGRYQARVTLPSFLAGATVDVTIHAADAGGSTFDQTVERAFRIGATS